MAYPVSGQQPWGADLKAYIDDTDAALAAADAALAAADADLVAADLALAAVDTALDDRLTTLEEDFQSGEGLDADVAGFVDDETSLTWGALNEQFASRETQDTVEAGRLNDSVLTNRFAVASIYISAAQMHAATGSPSNLPSSNLVPVWRLDASTEESAVCSAKVPKAWATFDIRVIGHNGGAGAGNVRLRTTIGRFADGDDITADWELDTEVFTAAAQNVRQSVLAHEGVAADPTRTVAIRVLRDADDAADTLGNDWFLSGVELVAASWVAFEPEVPEPPEDLDGQAFTQADNANLDGLRVWWSSNPPPDDLPSPTFKYYPGTDYSSSNSNYVDSEWTLGDKWYSVWAPRFNYGTVWNSQPNPFPAPALDTSTGHECRLVYTTREKAEAALQAVIRHICGNSAGTVQAPWIAAGGVVGDLIPEQDLRDTPDAYFTTDWLNDSGSRPGTTYKVAVDKVPLPTSLLSDGVNPSNTKGVRLDFEVQDDRTEAQTTALLTDITSTMHTAGYELYMYLTPLNSTIRHYSGLGPGNLPTVFGMVDHLSIFMFDGNDEGNFQDSWDNQIDLLGPLTTADWEKVTIVFQIGSASATTLADAEWTYDKLHEAGTDHPTLVEFWRNQAQMGGARNRLVNQKVEMVCFGTITT